MSVLVTVNTGAKAWFNGDGRTGAWTGDAGHDRFGLCYSARVTLL